MQQDLIAQAKAWLAEDPDPETRDELAGIVEAADLDELAARFMRHPAVRHRRAPR